MKRSAHAQPTRQDDFERIAMPHLAALLRVARRLTLDCMSAEDLVQETMLLAWHGFHGFQPGTNARAWLFRILFNVFHGAGRKASRAPAALPGSTAVHAGLQAAAEIAQALEALPLDQRTVLLLCAVEGFTCREAAGILDVPIGTVMSRLSRARQELRQSLGPTMKMAEAKEACR
jgi:RNA polymerase sigma-70 factor, ECF subfamily